MELGTQHLLSKHLYNGGLEKEGLCCCWFPGKTGSSFSTVCVKRLTSPPEQEVSACPCALAADFCRKQSCHESLVQQDSWPYSCHIDFGDLLSAPALLKQHPEQFVASSLPISAPLSQISSPLWLCGETEAKARGSLEGQRPAACAMHQSYLPKELGCTRLSFIYSPLSCIQYCLGDGEPQRKKYIPLCQKKTANTNNTSGSDEHENVEPMR